MTELTHPERHQLLLHAYAEDVYLRYAVATVKDRALPQVEDGQKPVQRRILYGMHQLGLGGGAKPVKSARIVGDVLGKLHPHGDSSVYDAMVRMAQDFSLRYPLVHGQGNYGSRDGDTAAAMRYTEARLAPIADLLLGELGQGTVDFAPNYDNTLQEPTRLPARLPFTLLNGAMGIAVGMATDIPPHNLREVAAAAIAVCEQPDISTTDLLRHLPGPDFPDGAQVISPPADIQAAYETGRGVLRARAVWTREELARGQYQLVVRQLPYQVSAKKVQEQIEALTNPQPPQGKKTVTPQQANLKAMALQLLEKVTDESDKSDPVRLVIVPRTAKVAAEDLMNFLFANTSLEESVSVNMTMVGVDGKPQTKGLRQILTEWAAFRLSTVRRRTQWELDVANRRIHLLEGRLTVYLNLDQVIPVIREADDPKADLMAKFALTAVQADDILDMRLRQLNKLEGIKLEKELDELRREVGRLTGLLRSEPALRKLIVKEIAADAEKYGDDRRTLLKPEARINTASAVVKTVPDEETTVILSKNLWVRARQGHDLDPSTVQYKPGDEAFAILATRTIWPVLVLDTKGRAYSVQASDIPAGRGDGVPLTTLIELQDGARVCHVFSGPPDELRLFAGNRGYGFVAPNSALVARPRAGKAFLTLATDELPLPPVVLPHRRGWVACGSSDGRLLVFPSTEVKALDKGKGVVLMALGEAQLQALAHLDQPQLTGILDIRGRDQAVALRGAEFDRYVLHRARKGCQLPKKGVLKAVAPAK